MGKKMQQWLCLRFTVWYSTGRDVLSSTILPAKLPPHHASSCYLQQLKPCLAGIFIKCWKKGIFWRKLTLVMSQTAVVFLLWVSSAEGWIRKRQLGKNSVIKVKVKILYQLFYLLSMTLFLIPSIACCWWHCDFSIDHLTCIRSPFLENHATVLRCSTPNFLVSKPFVASS